MKYLLYLFLLCNTLFAVNHEDVIEAAKHVQEQVKKYDVLRKQVLEKFINKEKVVHLTAQLGALEGNISAAIKSYTTKRKIYLNSIKGLLELRSQAILVQGEAEKAKAEEYGLLVLNAVNLDLPKLDPAHNSFVLILMNDLKTKSIVEEGLNGWRKKLTRLREKMNIEERAKTTFQELIKTDVFLDEYVKEHVIGNLVSKFKDRLPRLKKALKKLADVDDKIGQVLDTVEFIDAMKTLGKFELNIETLKVVASFWAKVAASVPGGQLVEAYIDDFVLQALDAVGNTVAILEFAASKKNLAKLFVYLGNKSVSPRSTRGFSEKKGLFYLAIPPAKLILKTLPKSGSRYEMNTFIDVKYKIPFEIPERTTMYIDLVASEIAHGNVAVNRANSLQRFFLEKREGILKKKFKTPARPGKYDLRLHGIFSREITHVSFEVQAEGRGVLLLAKKEFVAGEKIVVSYQLPKWYSKETQVVISPGGESKSVSSMPNGSVIFDTPQPGNYEFHLANTFSGEDEYITFIDDRVNFIVLEKLPWEPLIGNWSIEYNDSKHEKIKGFMFITKNGPHGYLEVSGKRQELTHFKENLHYTTNGIKGSYIQNATATRPVFVNLKITKNLQEISGSWRIRERMKKPFALPPLRHAQREFLDEENDSYAMKGNEVWRRLPTPKIVSARVKNKIPENIIKGLWKLGYKHRVTLQVKLKKERLSMFQKSGGKHYLSIKFADVHLQKVGAVMVTKNGLEFDVFLLPGAKEGVKEIIVNNSVSAWMLRFER
ncbi:hypothetical protein [Candidatus Uabimicrobium amorphum]|uniref:Uncharacterized protein n=1 Tax=Uabimicrobium amorphum TaxID=2596890 RepID=A0A5S9F7H7_UABAM|nr:hypothetical protein [Candidatus Uabimicrobium amorphum]BBM87729.1 hypothetical protein UABAM_06144 [Candidatus Uabimicrobium amorphum]